MSAYTDTCRRAALGAWRAVPKAFLLVPLGYREYRAKKREQPVGERAAKGCLTWLFFGPLTIGLLTLVLYLTLPLVFAAAAIAGAVVMSCLWGAGSAAEAVSRALR